MAKEPFVVIALKALGWILIVVALFGILPISMGSTSEAGIGLSVSVGATISALFAFGFAAIITKLCETEIHLRQMIPNQDATPERYDTLAI